MKNYIHELAFVHETAIIGENSKIWINSQIRENVIIGSNCIIGKDTYIDCNVKIGDNVKIQNGVSVYNGVTIQNDVFIGPNVVFTNDFYPRANNSDWNIIETLIKTGASIGGNSTIICGNVLGEYCMIGAGAVVTKNIQPYELAVGNPAKVVGYVCKCGNKLIKNKCNKCGFILILEN